MSLYIGLISGTSADAIDAVLLDFQTWPPQLLATLAYPFPPALRAAVLALSQSSAPVAPAVLAQLDAQIGDTFADAAQALLASAQVDASRVQAIGSHGQTLYHSPPRADCPGPFYSWQIGDPNRIAWRTGITTVADFRRKDLAAGGQGAPLVPGYHQALFRDPQTDRAVLNLGGIANLTWLPAEPSAPVIGFDTGPANALLDAWILRHRAQPQDHAGAWAASGAVLPSLLAHLLADPYFQLAAPKSTGRDYFNLTWLDAQLSAWGQPAAPPDVQATLLQLTVDSIAHSLRSFQPTQLLVCGGGVHNLALLTALQQAMPTCQVCSTAALGIDPDWVEACCFAWLAQQCLARRPGNLPSVTGAKAALVLGGIYYP